uniref:Uncharacterized protein n=1 Tax=Arundo donax TaxID=35708 RepID=A0A0A9BYG3_ARUDO
MKQQNSNQSHTAQKWTLSFASQLKTWIRGPRHVYIHPPLPNETPKYTIVRVPTSKLRLVYRLDFLTTG